MLTPRQISRKNTHAPQYETLMDLLQRRVIPLLWPLNGREFQSDNC